MSDGCKPHAPVVSIGLRIIWNTLFAACRMWGYYVISLVTLFRTAPHKNKLDILYDCTPVTVPRDCTAGA